MYKKMNTVMWIFCSLLLMTMHRESTAHEGGCGCTHESHEGLDADHMKEATTFNLEKIGRDVLQFFHDVGAHTVSADDQRIGALFAPNIEKKDSTGVFQLTRESLIPHLRGYGVEPDENRDVLWTVALDTADVLVTGSKPTIVVSFDWTHVTLGRAETVAILECNDEGKIKHITVLTTNETNEPLED